MRGRITQEPAAAAAARLYLGRSATIPDRSGTQASERLDAVAQFLADAPLNLVSRGDRDHVRDVHIAEAEAVTDALALARGASCLDLGSGGGLPGLVIAVLRPDVAVTCLDARVKKMRYVEHICRELGLQNVAALSGRAEVLARDPGLRGTFASVVSRALGATNVVAELGRGFLADGGRLTVVKGPDHAGELKTAQAVARPLALTIPTVSRVDAAPRPTWLIEMVAVGRPPSWVPRPDGVPQRDPLGEDDA